MKVTGVYHTHLNPDFTPRNQQPLFIAIEGSKDNCVKCNGNHKKSSNRPNRNS